MDERYGKRLAMSIIDCIMRMAADLEDAGAATERRRKLLCDMYDLAKDVEMMERASQEVEARSLSRVQFSDGN